MAPSSRKRSGAPTRGLGRSGGGNNIFDHIYKDNAIDAETAVSRALNIPIGVVRRLANALSDKFGDYPTSLTHLAAFVLNHGDTKEFRPFVEWASRNKARLKALRLPRYISKTLEAMASDGCTLLWDGAVTRMSREACTELLTVIAAVLLHITRDYADRGLWSIIEEGADAGDVYITFTGGGA
jgi:hypothetical protein